MFNRTPDSPTWHGATCSRADIAKILAEADGQVVAAMDPVTIDHMYGEMAQAIVEFIARDRKMSYP